MEMNKRVLLILFLALFLALLVVVGIRAYLIWQPRRRRGEQRKKPAPAEQKTDTQIEEERRNVREKDNARYRKLYEQGTMLREEMIKLNSGDRGMTALQELYLKNKDNNAASFYKSSFEMRQTRLREVLKEYKDIKEELKHTPYRLPDAADISDFEELCRIDLDKDTVGKEGKA